MRLILKSERLVLRPFDLADAERVARLTSDYRVASMLGRIPFPNPPIVVEGWMILNDGFRQKGEKYTFAVTTRVEGVIGSLSLTRKGEAWELSYWLGMDYTGHGYAFEAIRLALSWAEDEIGANCFTAGCYIDNEHSSRVLRKLGFEYSGVTEERFSLARGKRVQTRVLTRMASCAMARAAE